MISGIPNYENGRRVVFNVDGSIQYETKEHDDSVLENYKKAIEVIKKISE